MYNKYTLPKSIGNIFFGIWGYFLGIVSSKWNCVECFFVCSSEIFINSLK